MLCRSEASFPSELQDSISRQIQASKEKLEALKRQSAFDVHEEKLRGEELRSLEDVERDLGLSVQGLEPRHEALNAQVLEVIRSRSDANRELQVLRKEMDRIEKVDESSRIMSAGQECFNSFLKQMKRNEVNNNSPPSSSSHEDMNKEMDDLEAVLNKEYEDLTTRIAGVESRIKSVKEKIREERKEGSVNHPSVNRREKVKRLKRDKIGLSSQVLRLEQEYETYKLRTGKRGLFLKK